MRKISRGKFIINLMSIDHGFAMALKLAYRSWAVNAAGGLTW